MPVVLVLATTDDGKVVHTRKDSYEPWRWTVVAGFVERGQRAEDAALREVKEETNLESESVRFVSTHFPGRRDQLMIVSHVASAGARLRRATCSPIHSSTGIPDFIDSRCLAGDIFRSCGCRALLIRIAM